MSALSFSFGLCRLYVKLKRCNQHEDQRAVYGSTIWDVLRRKKALVYSATELVEERKTSAVDDKPLWEPWRKTLKQLSVTSPTTSTARERKYHNPLFAEDDDEVMTLARCRARDAWGDDDKGVICEIWPRLKGSSKNTGVSISQK